MRRIRALQPEPARKDGQEPFDLPVYPPPIILPQIPTLPAVQKSQADEMLASIPPAQQRRDPRLFDLASDIYRPSWHRALFPDAGPIILASDPRAAYRLGAQIHQAEAAASEEDSARAAAAEAKAQDRRGWTAGQYEEEL